MHKGRRRVCVGKIEIQVRQRLCSHDYLHGFGHAGVVESKESSSTRSLEFFFCCSIEEETL